jgi:predicted AlkP superfamily phosphohydrolase/phosphomutase
MHTAILAQYQLIDRELAALAKMLRPQDNLIIFADHGMQANYRGEHFMELMLKRLGLCESVGRARLGGEASESAPSDVARRKVRRLLHRLVRRIVPANVTSKLRGKFGAAARINWSRTRAIALPTDRNSYVRINVRGREPQGTVEPGEDYEATLQMLEREFRALVNGETGKPAVEEVFRAQELYAGPRAAELPDLVILWSSEAPINVLESPRLGRLEMRKTERRSGNHRPEGFLLAQGPAFKSGRVELQGDILQIPPTLLALHGVSCPDTFEMGPLTELFSKPAFRVRQGGAPL